MIWAATAVAGGLGAVVRVIVSTRVSERYGASRGTVCVNMLGTAGLALLVITCSSAELRLVLGVGLLGGLTTFSTWMVDALRLGMVDGVGAALLHIARVSALAVVIASVVLVGGC